MKNLFYGRDFIDANDFSKKEIERILEVAVKLKADTKKEIFKPYLLHKTLFLLFFFSSTRTRTSFEAAMDHLGGNSHDLTPEKLQIAHGDTPKEIGRILGSYGDGIAIRHCDWGVGNAYINEVAKYSTAPVFNMQCDIYHPFQAMADLLTIFEKKESPRKRKIVMSWAYAASYTKPISVPQSFLLLLSLFGADLVLAHPPKFNLMPEILERVKINSQKYGGSFHLSHKIKDAFKDADVVYPKSWGPLVTTTDPSKSIALVGRYKNWICNRKLMQQAKPDAIYMHCLPADRGLEVTDEVIDGKQSAVWQQAENRYHVQKAILLLTMAKKVKP